VGEETNASALNKNAAEQNQTNRKAVIMIAKKHLMLMAIGACVVGLPPITPLLSAAQRPIEDFLVTQGTYVPWGVTWTDLLPKDGANWAEIDYAGIKGAILELYGYPSLGTTFSGAVNERPLPDGRAEVDVVLQTHNALAWAGYSSGWAWPPEFLFGHDLVEVYFGATLALGDCTLKVKFINTAPGAPLPDFVQLAFDPQPGQEVISMYFIGQAEGVMADGSPGHLKITQVGLLAVAPPKPPFFDSFPAGNILLKRVGQ